jgi:hypothetical protein
MNISAIPTDSELRALSLLIPTYFGLAVVERQVVMTLYTHGQNPPRPLVSYTIVPESQPDYTGLPLAETITTLAEQVKSHYHAMQASPDSLFMRILQIANDPPLLTNTEEGVRGLQVSTREVHSARESDWFPATPTP